MKRKLAAIDRERIALEQSINLLESANVSVRSGSPAKAAIVTVSLPSGNTGVRDAIRRYLSQGQLPVEEIKKRIQADFPGLLQRSPRAVDTALYKLARRSEIEIRQEGTRKTVALSN
ncbi:MAG TPA: hypothetical protein VF773_16715 [Verrucomicrobiae bacterium]